MAKHSFLFLVSLSFSLVLSLSISTNADVIKLNSGTAHKGTVTAEEEGRVQLKLEGSGVRIWFQRDQIASVEKDPAPPPKKEAENVEPENQAEPESEDVARAKELLKKLREQPETQDNRKKSSAASPPSETAAPMTPTGSQDEIEALIAQLRNGQIYDRLNACKKLGSLGAKEAIPHLIHFLDDESIEIRKESHNALKKITGKDFGFKPADRRNVRLWAIDQWKKWFEEEKKKESDSGFKWRW